MAIGIHRAFPIFFANIKRFKMNTKTIVSILFLLSSGFIQASEQEKEALARLEAQRKQDAERQHPAEAPTVQEEQAQRRSPSPSYEAQSYYSAPSSAADDPGMTSDDRQEFEAYQRRLAIEKKRRQDEEWYAGERRAREAEQRVRDAETQSRLNQQQIEQNLQERLQAISEAGGSDAERQAAIETSAEERIAQEEHDAYCLMCARAAAYH
jgi:hypothetical protein